MFNFILWQWYNRLRSVDNVISFCMILIKYYWNIKMVLLVGWFYNAPGSWFRRHTVIVLSVCPLFHCFIFLSNMVPSFSQIFFHLSVQYSSIFPSNIRLSFCQIFFHLSVVVGAVEVIVSFITDSCNSLIRSQLSLIKFHIHPFHPTAI